MMQPDVFAQAIPLLKDKKININTDIFITLMSKYRVNSWVYPGVIHNKLHVSINDVYKALDVCTEKGLLERYLQIHCPKCQCSTGNCYKTALEIPEIVTCTHCDEEIKNPLQYAIVIYKVI